MKTKTEATHTETPWHLSDCSAWSDSCKDRGPVFVCNLVTGTHITENQNKANAEFIVRAVNAYDKMRSALEQLRDVFEDGSSTQVMIDEAIAQTDERP